MANGIRALLRPVLQTWPKGQLVSGLTLGLDIFGQGPGELAKGDVKAAKLILHGAFLNSAREEAKSKAKFEQFATLSGKLQLKFGKPVFVLPAKGTVEYEKPEPASGKFRRISLGYETPAFEGRPAALIVTPDQPLDPDPLSILRLPEEPKGAKFLMLGAEIEIEGAKSSELAQNDKLDVPLPPIRLAIVKIDDHFAPSVDKCEIKYKVGGLLGSRVTLEITSKHYSAGPVYKRLLTPEELEDGLQTISWDGRCNPSSGDLKDRYLTPLFGPYELKLSDGAKHESKGHVKVLYHSLELKQGEYTVDGKEPPRANKKDWAQYKLNELGYYGGPVGHDFDDYLKKALIRYKANHTKLHLPLIASYDDVITADVEVALAANENKRVFIEGDGLSKATKTAKLFVEALTYEEKAGNADEFLDAKAPLEKQRLNRPLIPVLVDIFLLGKNGKKALAPEATGPVRVNFSFTDPLEDLTRQFPNTAKEPSKTRAYLDKALKLKGGRVGTVGDNAHKDFGGIRDAAANDFETPFLVGTAYEPFEVKKDAGQKVCFSLAHADATKNKQRLGQAGFFFRPSCVAGDSYKLKAEIDFTGLPNAADLDKLHHVDAPKHRIHVSSGKLEIWRSAKIAAQITWPARSNSNQWDLIRTEFQKAFVDLDISNIDVQPITAFLSDAEYKAIVAANTAHAAPTVSLDPGFVVGVPLPAQGAQNAATYTAALRTFTSDNYFDPINADLRRKLSQNVRKKHATGFVVAEFLTHKPVDVQTAPPGNTTVSKANKGVVIWAFSIGLPDSVIFADQKDPDHVYYVVSHEMGHNFWLQHWENTGGGTPTDHDSKDHNCSMSYSGSLFPHQAPGVYTPHFCGQCNLKLRGWNIDDPQIPASS